MYPLFYLTEAYRPTYTVLDAVFISLAVLYISGTGNKLTVLDPEFRNSYLFYPQISKQVTYDISLLVVSD
jgi:hypothetical protein